MLVGITLMKLLSFRTIPHYICQMYASYFLSISEYEAALDNLTDKLASDGQLAQDPTQNPTQVQVENAGKLDHFNV